MKRYVRTINGKIIDTTRQFFIKEYKGKNFPKYQIEENKIFAAHFKMRNEKPVYDDELGYIEKQSDTIEKLIEVGDLVFDDEEDSSFCFIVKRIYKEYGMLCFEGEFECSRYADTISKLYTKQGNNYILVWTKEKGVI